MGFFQDGRLCELRWNEIRKGALNVGGSTEDAQRGRLPFS